MESLLNKETDDAKPLIDQEPTTGTGLLIEVDEKISPEEYERIVEENPSLFITDILQEYADLEEAIKFQNTRKKGLRGRIEEYMRGCGETPGHPPVAFSVGKREIVISIQEVERETVTKEGKSFLKIHATPEIIDSLVKVTKSERLVIKIEQGE